MNQSDTICALATAPGVAGIAVVRVSGPKAFELVDQLFHSTTKISLAPSHSIHYGRFKLSDEMQDEVTISVFRSPRSYTGEDVAEISCHGGFVVPDLVISTLLEYGARHADAGEFTKRAFLNGKMDLTQVESVAELIHSSSSASAAIAAKQLHGVFRDNIRSMRQGLIDICALLELELDFANEDLELIPKARIRAEIESALRICKTYLQSFTASNILRSGFHISLIGHPNAGKSLLFNELLMFERSIVHDSAGTTRDYIQESVLWNGLRVVLSDTAGLRQTTDQIEERGVALASERASDADLILIINDCSLSLSHSNNIFQELKQRFPEKNIEVVQNKADLIQASDELATTAEQQDIHHFVSAKTGHGMDQLRNYLSNLLKKSIESSKEALLNQRHLDLLHQTEKSLLRAGNTFDSHEFAEVVAFEIRQGIDCLGSILGETFNEEVLHSVFSKFCIGK